MDMELLNLEGLTTEERTIILNVIRRDDELRRRQDNRVSQLKGEIHNLRMNSVLRNGDDLSKMCARCKSPFGMVTNTGDVCPACRFKVCKNCRERLLSHGWLCVLCCKENQMKWLTGDWMAKNKTQAAHNLNATDLVRASLRVQHANGNLGGLEERASHNGGRAVGRVDFPQDSDRKRLSALFTSIKSGLGGGAPEEDSSAAQGAVGGVVADTDGRTVHRVSCRRRRDSNSSSNSDLDQASKSPSKRELAASTQTNGSGRKPYVPRYAHSQTESARNFSDSVSGGGSDPRINSLSLSSDASVSTIKDGSVVRVKDTQGQPGRGDQHEVVPPSEPQPHPRGGKRMLPQVGVKPVKKGEVTEGHQVAHRAVDGKHEDDRASSGCSFTSSEFGDLTPTDTSHLITDTSHPITPQSSLDKKEETESGLAQSSGYMTASRKNGDEPDSAPRKKQQRRSGTTYLPPEITVQSSQPPGPVERAPEVAAPDHVEPSKQHADNDKSPQHPALTHVRRQSSGRSETLSLGSARTASPATKMRLLDMAGNRAMERDTDSVKSWSGASDDTMSLGMSCSGIRASPEIPASLAQKVSHKKRPPGGIPDAADNFQIPAINRSRQPDGDHASGSEYSGHGSPDKLRGSSQLLSPPSIGTSHTGSLNEDSRESLASVYSDAGEINYGRIPVTGDIVFGLDYDHKKSALIITIKGCHDLAPVDIKHNRSDPYVKVYLLPDKTRSGKRKSKIKKHTLSPVYNETLTYNISRGELENRTLWVTVWHSDRFGRNDFLGEVLIPMDTYRFDDPSPRAYSLQTRMQENISEEAMLYKGDLVISLMYITPDHADGPNNKKSKSKSKKSKSASQPQGEIHCMIKAAKNLTAVRSSGASDPFVKGYLLPERTRTGKQKTSVVKNSVNPTWNHNLEFDGVEKEELADRCLELTVWDHEKLGTNEFLGGARLNLGHGTVKGSQVEWMDARGEEVTAWQSMIESPNTWIDARLPLRASMGKPSKK